MQVLVMNKLGAVMVALLMLSGCASTLDDKTYSDTNGQRVSPKNGWFENWVSGAGFLYTTM